MDPTERLANDLQELKKRFDDMSLRFAVSEEREKRVDDKIDNLISRVDEKMNSAVASIKLELSGVKKTMDDKTFVSRAVLIGAVGIIVAAAIRWVLAGNLAGVL